MTRVKDIINIIEEFAPLSLQEEYDNSGLIIGDRDAKADKVLIALDITDAVIEEAKEIGADMIVTHHPLIFNPIRSITLDTVQGLNITNLISNKIAVYSAHTSLDNAEEGIAKSFLDKLKADSIEPLSLGGCALMGTLKTPITLRQLILLVGEIAEEYNLKSIGDLDEEVSTIIVANGANGGREELIYELALKGDVLITAELKYHLALLAAQMKLKVLELGHYESEIGFVSLILRKLQAAGVNAIASDKGVSPYNGK